MVYAGQAEILALVGLALVILVLVLFVQRALPAGGSGPIRRPVLDLVISGAHRPSARCTTVAARPPGRFGIPTQRARRGSGGDVPGNPALPSHNLVHFVFQGFDGLPIVGQPLVRLRRRLLRDGRLRGRHRSGAGGRAAVAVRRRRPEVVASRSPRRRHGGGRLLPSAGVGPVPTAAGRNRAVAAGHPSRSPSAWRCWPASGWTPWCAPATSGPCAAGWAEDSRRPPCCWRGCGSSAAATYLPTRPPSEPGASSGP